MRDAHLKKNIYQGRVFLENIPLDLGILNFFLIRIKNLK